MAEPIPRAQVATTEADTLRGARRVIAVATFAVLTALGAYAVVPLPLTPPLPLTLQVLFVILAGAMLGPHLGAASQVTYLTAGMVGLPVFSGGHAGLPHLLGPTGGYLLAFPAAAFVVGKLAGTPPPVGAPTPGRVESALVTLRVGVALALGSAVILLGGTAQLAIYTGDPVQAVKVGVVPFILGDLLKVLAALLVALRLRSRTLGLV